MCVFIQVLICLRVLTSVYPKLKIKKCKLSVNRCVNVKQNALKTTLWQAHETVTSVPDHPVQVEPTSSSILCASVYKNTVLK